jgi:dynactin complex subunit
MQGDIGAFQATMSYELSKIDRIRQAQIYGERLLCVTETQAEENARMRETIVKAQKIVADLIAERDTLTKALEHSAKTLDTQLEKNNELTEELEKWERLDKLIPDFLKPILLGK